MAMVRRTGTGGRSKDHDGQVIVSSMLADLMGFNNFMINQNVYVHTLSFPAHPPMHLDPGLPLRYCTVCTSEMADVVTHGHSDSKGVGYRIDAGWKGGDIGSWQRRSTGR